MPAEAALPGAGADGFFGLRFESIGGLGAHLAGQILAEAGVLRAGLNGSHFSSYGSEKKGSPVRSFIRFCPAGRAIRRSDPIEQPQVVVVFHETLLAAPGTTAGLEPGGTLIVNTAAAPDELRERTGVQVETIGAVDALQIAVDEGSRVNTAMLGATARVCPFVPKQAIRNGLAERLGRRYPQLLEANLRTFDRGYDELLVETVPVAAPHERGAPVRARPAFGYLEAPIGGAVLDPASSIVRDLGISREGFLPALDLDKCVHCGLCDIVCPDLCFVWEIEDGAVRLRGIDYRYCKGCRKCTETCPTGALAEIREEDGWADAHRVPLYPWLDTAGAR